MKEYIAYHGTNSSNARKINDSKCFVYKKDRVGYLGTGSYFFDESYKRAFDWAKYITERKRRKDPSVLRVEIMIPEDKIFDTTDPNGENVQKFEFWEEELLPGLLKENGLNIKGPGGIEGVIYNTICDFEKYDAVRAYTHTYTGIERKHQVSTRIPNTIEICLRKNKYVKKINIEKGDQIV
ncbi:hypothetical protein [Peribacillus muralis]|uniref:hypothetical protein n=1 Tax=Peribacillus muralis TaxID=264697 RepID=UPI00366E58E9